MSLKKVAVVGVAGLALTIGLIACGGSEERYYPSSYSSSSQKTTEEKLAFFDRIMTAAEIALVPARHFDDTDVEVKKTTNNKTAIALHAHVIQKKNDCKSNENLSSTLTLGLPDKFLTISHDEKNLYTFCPFYLDKSFYYYSADKMFHSRFSLVSKTSEFKNKSGIHSIDCYTNIPATYYAIPNAGPHEFEITSGTIKEVSDSNESDRNNSAYFKGKIIATGDYKSPKRSFNVKLKFHFSEYKASQPYSDSFDAEFKAQFDVEDVNGEQQMTNQSCTLEGSTIGTNRCYRYLLQLTTLINYE